MKTPWSGLEEMNLPMNEFHCDVTHDECPFSLQCSRQREIPLDNGYFGHIPRTEDWVSPIEDTRKHCERPFNLIKHRNGIDRITVKSQHAAQVVQTTATIAVLLIEIVRYKQNTPEVQKQIEIPLGAS